MTNSLFDNTYLGSFKSADIDSKIRLRISKNWGTSATGMPVSSYLILDDESDGQKKVHTALTMKELQTIIKHIPDVQLYATFSTLRYDMDVNDPSSFPYIFPDYDTTRLYYDIIYDAQHHEKMITILSMWLNIQHRQIAWNRLYTSDLCQEIIL